MPKIKPIRINIVEEEGWKNWDYAQPDGISQWASDNAWDDWANMSDRDCQGYVQELIDASMTKAERKKIGEEDLERICEELKENTWENLESTMLAITDAHQFAWEVAYAPDDRDIEKAMEKAKRNWDWDFTMGDYWNLILQEEAPEGPREWSPRGRWTVAKLYEDLVGRIRHEHKSGHYDQFMIFDWGDSEPVKVLLEALKKNPDEGNSDDVENELRDFTDRYMDVFFKELEERMQQNDPSYNWDLDPHWKSVLKDKQRMSGVREEILEFLAKPKKEEVED